MEEKFKFTDEEKLQLAEIATRLRKQMGDSIKPEDESNLRQQLEAEISDNKISRDIFGLNPILLSFQTAELELEEIGMKRECVLAIMLYNSIISGNLSLERTEQLFGKSVAQIIHGLVRIHELYTKTPVIESENFRNLLLSFAEDMRVILIMITDRVNLMRQIRDTENTEAKLRVAEEASYLYAPLAHKLGLYKLKSELEDLSLKYLEHDAYYMIKDKLNATKRSRDAYIEKFITPIDEKLKQMGIKCHIKGRTKSIHSIWQKMKKQQCGFEGIYDLFAIRIIIDSPYDQEKMLCWQTYSLITDMYQPNPKRLRDWLSVPKSNGYESLHITVLGPEQKWVEVQIRTERMDEIAERGLAAHWRYKGIKGESGLDEWLNNIRTALENSDDMQLMDQFKMDLYEDEVFVFTPKGDLLKFPKGATILDFAYHIHSGVGNKCVGGKINGRNVPIREPLRSGDTVEILTQNNQSPKRDWLNIVQTSRGKAKVRQALKETQVKDGLFAKEILERRFKNRKVDVEESIMSHLIKRMGFKETSDFYKQIVDNKLDANDVVDRYIEERDRELNQKMAGVVRSAEEFSFDAQSGQAVSYNNIGNDDELVIDQNLKGVDYSLAQCCHPIYGDPIFGFVTVSGGIVNNITSIISKEEKIVMKSINIDSHDGLFSGNLNVLVDDTSKLESLLKKLRTVKGVKSVARL